MGRSKTKKIILYSFLGLCFIGLAVFATYESKRLVEGPLITLNESYSGISTTSSYLNISGIIQNASETSLNGRKIFIDSSGKFDEKTVLSEGVNRIYIEAKDRFGKYAEKTIEIVMNR
ncbi:MAG: hypothetical protein WCP15_01415 [bacterium]